MIIKKKYFINLSAFENVTIKEHPFETEINKLSKCLLDHGLDRKLTMVNIFSCQSSERGGWWVA